MVKKNRKKSHFSRIEQKNPFYVALNQWKGLYNCDRVCRVNQKKG
jgi:hypothetical protein